ncbi:DEAD/DEAH box helicase, partial [Roseomonas sp. DSM 102946]|nr:DEAD/DEAH box helicase [Roseomonas sp. DSM 102946]
HGLQAPERIPGPEALDRLAYDELLAGQIAIGLVRRAAQTRPGRMLTGDGGLREKALAAFGHPPTGAQRQAIAEIDADLAAPRRMLRLLQGDVGSGKTLVALMAMLRAVEAGAQAAIMAPTEILARQHLRTFSRLAGAAGVQVALLAGSVKGKERSRVLLGLASGSIPLVVGTHALFQEKVAFRDLGLVVVDEQHRFGVAQRLALA